MSLRKRRAAVQRLHAGYWLGACLLLLLGSSLALGQYPVKKNGLVQSSRHADLRLAERRKARWYANASTGTDRDGKLVHLREGKRITDEIGTFTVQGDNVTFTSHDGRLQIGGLRNLNLERILDDSSRAAGEKATWIISGVITEFKGSNYVLITRVIKKAASSLRHDDPQ